MSRWAIWHGRAMWFGIILNMFFVFSYRAFVAAGYTREKKMGSPVAIK